MLSKYFAIGFMVQFFVFSTLLGKSVEAQLSSTVSDNLEHVTVEKVINVLSKRAQLNFVYDSKDIDVAEEVSITGKDLKAGEVLNDLSELLGLSYKKVGSTITLKKIKKKEKLRMLPALSMSLSSPSLSNHSIGYVGSFYSASTVSGTVTDSSGNPLIGVTVKVKGTTKGAVTDANGHFEIDADEDATLVFSYVGYQDQEVPVDGRTNIEVVMSSGATGLNEVVVVAYGEKQKKDLNSSISTLDMDDVAPIPVASINDAVAGRIPGVITTSSSGAPGSKSQISIRGGDNPLFVIDGIIRSKNDFENLDPNDIESYSILKDAAATSLYGARGGNGVVLITTKKGEAGQVQINYSFNQIWSQPTIRPERMSSYDHALAKNKVYEAEGKTAPVADSILQYYKDQSKPYLYPNTNWQDLFLKKFAPGQRHDLSVTSGTRKLTYYASGSYFHQGTLLKTDHNSNNRVTYRLNTVSHFDKIGLKVRTGIDGFVEKNELPNSSTASNYLQLFSHVQNKHSNQLAFNEFGLPSAQTSDNPAVELSDLSGYNKTTSRIFNSILALDWKVPFVEGLHVKGKGSYNMWNSRGKSWNATAPSYNNGSKVPIPGNPPDLSESWGEGKTFTLQGFLTYTHDFNKHHLDFTGVYEQSQDFSSSLSGARKQYQIIYDQFVAGPTENQEINGDESESARASFLGRLSYNYASKYYLDATYRYDGMDLFPPNKRWGSFYAFAGGWIVSAEPFFQSLQDKNILNYLKLRASTGLTGTITGISRFQYVPGYNVNANVWVVDDQEKQGTSEPASLPSTNFSWFSIRSWDVGLDFSTLGSRLSGSLDYYYKRTTGYVTADTRFSETLGIGLPPINFKDGAHRRAGTEFNLSWRDQSGDFHYQVGVNFTYFNQLWERNPDEDEADLKDPYTRSSGTSDASLETGYVSNGFYQNNEDLLEGPRRINSVNIVAGDLRYIDENGDGKIDDNDFRHIGSNTFPRINYGITFDLSYKGFYLNGSVMGSGKRDRYLGDVIQGSSAQAQLVYAFQKDYWRPDNQNALFPRAVSSAGVNGSNNFVTSDFWLLRSSFLRLKALQLGYDFTNSLLKASPFTTLRVFVSGTNLLTASKSLKYYIDPESNPNNYDYPIQRTISVGVKVGF